MRHEQTPPDKEFERILESLGLLGALAQLKKPAAIVADDAVLSRLRKGLTTEGARLIPIGDVTPTRFPTPLPGPYFVATVEDELATKQRLRSLLVARGIRAEIYGVLHDLTPMPLTETWEREPAGFEAKLESLYCNVPVVIACTPRSGSQYLARTLEEHGVGAPREHIRPAVISLLTEKDGRRIGSFRFLPWLASVSHQASRNGIFSTKLISHFLAELERHLEPAEWCYLQSLISKSHLIYLLRSDKLMQALSRDRAKITQQYHLFNEVKREQYQRASQVWSYDFQRIVREIRQLEEQEMYLFSLVTKAKPRNDFTFLHYETMDAPGVAEQLRKRLGLQQGKGSMELPTNILRDQQTSDFHERFLKEYRAAYRPQSPETHAALRVSYDSDNRKLEREIDPDRIAAP